MYKFVAFGHSHIVAFAKGAYEYQASDLPPDAPRIDGRFAYLYDPAYNPVLAGPPGIARIAPEAKGASGRSGLGFPGSGLRRQ